MYSRVFILYFIVLLLDMTHGTPLKNKIKQKLSIRSGDNEQQNIKREKVNETGSIDTVEEKIPNEIENKNDTDDNNSGNTRDLESEKNRQNKLDPDVDEKNGGDVKSEDKGNVDNRYNEESGQKQNKYEDIDAVDSGEDKESNKVQYRPYTVGDTFTPQELLPITIKLRSKVENPGGGKGFVSATKNAEQLADKLFEAFFMTFKRIVILSEPDIAGLDALQALALSGEAIDNTTVAVTEPGQTKYLRGQLITFRNKPRSSVYKLILKRINPKDYYENAKRRGIQLAHKLKKKKRRSSQGERLKMSLKKKRRLVVNKRRHALNKNSTKEKDSACHWRYECSDPADLDTCTLITQCVNQKKSSKVDPIAIPHRSDEHSKSMQQFRKMLGIALVDEEVEKILESRVIRLNPSKLKADERVESLSEYFNNIVMEQELATTTALSPSGNDDDTTETNNDNGSEELKRKRLKH